MGVGGNGNLVVSFNCLFIGKWFTEIGKVHPLSILLYVPVYYPPLYPENRSWYIFLCLFALGLLNKKTQFTKSLSAHCTSEL